MPFRRSLMLLVVFLLTLAGSAKAQSGARTLTGSITDSQAASLSLCKNGRSL